MLLAAALVVAASGSALAVEVMPGGVDAKFAARFSPQRLSKSERTPLSPWVSMRFEEVEGAYRLPALEEFEIEEDRHLQLNLNGVPVCSPGNRDEPPIKQRCKMALIGSGNMETDFFFPETASITTQGEVTIYNGGRRNGVRTLYMDTSVVIPKPAEIVIKVEVRHSDLGRYGLKLVGSVPKIAGGSGSVASLEWRFHKSIFSATCPPDRHLDTRFTTAFADGTGQGGTVARDCTPAP
jgi:hypothetical protein